MGQEVGAVAAGILQGVGQQGEVVGLQRAGGQRAVVVGVSDEGARWLYPTIVAIVVLVEPPAIDIKPLGIIAEA